MLKITITYKKNGNMITEKAINAGYCDGKFCYTPYMNPSPMVVVPVMIPVENIESVIVEEVAR